MSAQDSEVVAPVEEEVKVYKTFDSMDLPVDLLRAIFSHGFETPSDIQKKGIKVIADGRDLIAQACSGTGKTGTFTIGSLARVDPSIKKVQVLCLAPTRELAEQIHCVATSLGEHMNIKAYAALGKTPVRDDIRALDRGVHFLVGTPGRIYDLMSRKAFTTEYVKVIIVDEADQMLEDRFREQLQCILSLGFPATCRCALFSATMNEDVVEFANGLLIDPVRILIPAEQVSLKGIRQYRVDLEREDWKIEVLLDLYKNLNIAQALIYCNKRQKAEWLAETMTKSGFPITCIHGDMDVKDRMERMKSFRRGETRVLISTDLLARGIDVQQVSLVINYELPREIDNYIHRIGRSGRYGRKGTAINLLSTDDLRTMRELEEHYKMTVEQLPQDLSVMDLS
uniref:Helicase n=1 Tax=viral metagenome TaxID=1070528 RepID=A0A6C0K6A2_9ZZZZ